MGQYSFFPPSPRYQEIRFTSTPAKWDGFLVPHGGPTYWECIVTVVWDKPFTLIGRTFPSTFCPIRKHFVSFVGIINTHCFKILLHFSKLRRGAVVKGVDHISTNLLVNI